MYHSTSVYSSRNPDIVNIEICLPVPDARRPIGLEDALKKLYLEGDKPQKVDATPPTPAPQTHPTWRRYDQKLAATLAGHGWTCEQHISTAEVRSSAKPPGLCRRALGQARGEHRAQHWPVWSARAFTLPGGVEEEQVDESSQAIEECGTFRRTCDVYVCACEASEVTVLFCKYQYPAPPKGVVGRKLHGEGGLQATPLVEEKYLGGMPRLQKHTCEILDGVLKVTASSEIHARFTPESLTSTQSPTHHYWSLWWKSAFA